MLLNIKDNNIRGTEPALTLIKIPETYDAKYQLMIEYIDTVNIILIIEHTFENPRWCVSLFVPEQQDFNSTGPIVK